MGRGSSKAANNRAGGTAAQAFPEAFAPGKDFEAVNGVNHTTRTVSRMTQAEWDTYVARFGSDVSSSDEANLMKDWDGTNLYGYVRTTNAMAINAQLYSNADKSPDQIFNKRAKRCRNGADP